VDGGKRTSDRPPVSGMKFKALFGSGTNNEEGEGRETLKKRLSSASQIFSEGQENGSLKKRLSSASQFFHPKPDHSNESSPVASSRSNGETVLQTPLTPTRPSQTTPTFKPNFSLAKTTSPEGQASPDRRRASWQPSYPAVLPEGADMYANLSPDGHYIGPIDTSTPAQLGSENEQRRISREIKAEAVRERQAVEDRDELDLLGPELIQTKASPMIPENGQLPTPDPSPDEEGVDRLALAQPQIDALKLPHSVAPLTPPESSVGDRRSTDSVTPKASVDSADTADTVIPTSPVSQSSGQSSGRPVLSLVTSGGSNEAQFTAEPSSAVSQRSSRVSSPLARASAPTSALPGRPRPDMPTRRTTLISSPPMPQPIKNLPTLNLGSAGIGWPNFMLREGSVPGTPQASGTRTPNWSGGVTPRTPGWGGLTSPGGRVPGTPSAGGFPFSLPTTNPTQTKRLSEDELRRAKRAMVS
jgi:hypothetical protein